MMRLHAFSLSFPLPLLLLLISCPDNTLPALVDDFRFRSSLCYNEQGRVVVGLQCPQTYIIRTRAAFTGISRSNGCSYSPVDCAIHEGRTYKCDGNNKCQVQVTFEQDTELSPLTCGGAKATSAYFQVEYDCLSASGSPLLVTEYTSLQEKVGPDTPGRERPDMAPTINVTQAGESTKHNDDFNGKIKIMGIVAGGGGALIIVISILAVIVRRLHRKDYPQPCYPPPSGPASSIPSRHGQHWSRDDHSTSDLSAPGSVSSLFPKQSLRDFQLLRGYHPRGVTGSGERPGLSRHHDHHHSRHRQAENV